MAGDISFDHVRESIDFDFRQLYANSLSTDDDYDDFVHINNKSCDYYSPDELNNNMSINNQDVDMSFFH